MLKYFPFGQCFISKRDELKSTFLIFYYLILELITFAKWICLNYNLWNDFLSVSKTHTCDSSTLIKPECNEYELFSRSLLNQSALPSFYALLFSLPFSFSFILSLVFPPYPSYLLSLSSVTQMHMHIHIYIHTLTI